MKVEIMPAKQEHIALLLPAMREREREVYSTDPEAVVRLQRAIALSAEAWAGFIDDEIVCMWGIDRGTMLTNSAFVWLITCVGIDEHPLTFVRHAKIRLEELCQRYSYIHGIVETNNEPSMRWLRWLDFKFGDVEFLAGYALRRFSKVS